MLSLAFITTLHNFIEDIEHATSDDSPENAITLEEMNDTAGNLLPILFDELLALTPESHAPPPALPTKEKLRLAAMALKKVREENPPTATPKDRN